MPSARLSAPVHSIVLRQIKPPQAPWGRSAALARPISGARRPRYSINASPAPAKHTNMEEENKIDEQNTPVEQETPAAEAPAEPQAQETAQPEAAKQTAPKKLRKNGRNRSGARSSSAATASNSCVCGEIEDLGAVKEKLSGKNIGGYGERPQKTGCQAEDRPERRERRPRREEQPSENAETEVKAESAEVAVEISETVETEAKSDATGPSFETKEFKPRAIEVPLSDKRVRGAKDSRSSTAGAVSYSPESLPPVSLMARIKEAIKSLFGGSEKKSKSGKGAKEDRKGGDRKFHGERRRDGKGGHHRGGSNRHGSGGGKRRYNNDRKHTGGGRNGGRSGGGNNTPQS